MCFCFRAGSTGKEQMEDGDENDPDEDIPSEASINMFLYVLKP